MKTSMATCQKRLATLWFAGAAAPFLLLFTQTAFGKFGPDPTEAWGWYSQAVVPTLALIVSVLVMESRGRTAGERRADAFLFKLAFGLSAAYLVIVTLTLLMQPFAMTAWESWLKQSNLWLGLMQGVVSASLGAFFVKPASA
jgi:hypothetical protein